MTNSSALLSLKIANQVPQVTAGDKVTFGQVVFRPKQTKVDKFNLADLLQVKPKYLSKYLKIKPGTQVKSGDVLAKKVNLLQKLDIKSPSEGKFEIIDEVKGIAAISKSYPGKETLAWFSGKVKEVDKNKVVFEVNGHSIKAEDGKGEPVSGQLLVIDADIDSLSMPTEVERCILAIREALPAIVAKANTLGALAIIAEKIDEPSFKLPYLQIQNISQLKDYNHRTVIVSGDEKHLLIISSKL